MRIFAILIFSLLSTGLFAQQDITSDVSAALKSGSAAELGKYFASNIDLTLPSEEDVYAKDQAIKYVTAFFSNNSPSDFKVIHSGTSKLNDHFRIGELNTSKGMYRVTFFMKKDGSDLKISQFRIEEADED